MNADLSPSTASGTVAGTGLGRQIAALAIPAFATLVSEPLLLMADSAFVGHLGTAELGALGIAGQVVTIVLGLCVFLAYGTTSVVARLLGSGHRERALAGGIDGMVLGLGLGLILAVTIELVAPHLVGLYGASPLVHEMGVGYLRIACLGLPFLLVSLASTGVLRGLQDTRTPLVVAIAVNLVNVALNWVLIYPMGLGLTGSAIGTLVSQAGGAVALSTVVLRGARAAGAPLGFNPGGVLSAARQGGWLVLRSLWLQLGLFATMTVAARTGAIGLAGHQVTNSLWAFICLALDALAIAAQALVGHELGAGRDARARRITLTLCWWGAGGGIVLALLLVALRTLIAPVFTPDPAVQHLLHQLLLALALITPIGGIVFVLDGVLIGAGDAKYLAAAGFVATAALLPMAWAVDAGRHGVVWLWVAYGGYLLVRALTLVVRARTDAWQRLGA